MYLSRTPLRISFFGGGSDYREYFEHMPGCVVGSAIDKYIYITGMHSESFGGVRYWIGYSVNEATQSVDEISHPAVREVLKWMKIDETLKPGKSLSLSVISNLPARTGLGSSSSFAVGIINLMTAMDDIPLTAYDLAQRAIHLEQDILKENVGIQDQLHASFGGFNKINFSGKDHISIEPIKLSTDSLSLLNNSLYLVSSDIARFASKSVDEQLANTRNGSITHSIEELVALAQDSVAVFESSNNSQMLQTLIEMLHDGWKIKRTLSSKVSNDVIDKLYDTMRSVAPVGGKLCGAGAGGFLLMVVPEEYKACVENSIRPRTLLPIKIAAQGSTIFKGF